MCIFQTTVEVGLVKRPPYLHAVLCAIIYKLIVYKSDQTLFTELKTLYGSQDI